MAPLKTTSPCIILASLCSGLVFMVLRYGLRYRYQPIYGNLARALPTEKPDDVIRLVDRHYRHLSDLCVEPFLFALASASLRNQLARFTNTQLPDELYRAGKPVVLLASH